MGVYCLVPFYHHSLISHSLLIQFDDMGDHGTKIIVFNLWLNDDGDMELDFNSDKKVSWPLLSLEISMWKSAICMPEP